jgi:hypothetical protein
VRRLGRAHNQLLDEEDVMLDDETRSYQQFIEEWFAGIEYEVRYWDNFVETKRALDPQDYEWRTMPAPPFCYGHIPELPSWPPTILDVGAGPISRVGISTSAGNVNLMACDPLAPIYDTILRKHNVVPYVRSEFALAERLTERYGANRFDAVIMQNALDHAFYAVDGFLELFNIAKIGGQILLLHAENEAEFESYAGFHQWNITADGDKLVFWRKDTRVVVNDLLGDCATITNETSLIDPSQWPERRWVKTKITKHKPIETLSRKHLSIYDASIANIVYKALSPTFRQLVGADVSEASELARLREVEAKYREVEVKYHVAKTTLDSVYASKSWKVTRALSRLAAPMRGLIRNGWLNN